MNHVMLLLNTWIQWCLFHNWNVVIIQPVMYCILKLHFCDANLFRTSLILSNFHSRISLPQISSFLQKSRKIKIEKFWNETFSNCSFWTSDWSKCCEKMRIWKSQVVLFDDGKYNDDWRMWRFRILNNWVSYSQIWQQLHITVCPFCKPMRIYSVLHCAQLISEQTSMMSGPK